MRYIHTILALSIFLLSCKKSATPEPIPTVTIGSQVWMLKNLDVTNYSNGEPIPYVPDSATWAKLTTGAWCYYNNDPSLNNTYGKLYNWYAVNDARGLAPAGFHVPSDAEWTTLSTFLGGDSVAGGKLKERGIIHWKSSNTAGTNSSGLTCLPGGSRYYNGVFYYIGIYGFWWSSTRSTISSGTAWSRNLRTDFEGIDRSPGDKEDGYSVRCLKD